MTASPKRADSITAPLRHSVFRRIWLASLLSNLGLLIQGVGAAWAMTQMTSTANKVALVQTALMLPIMLISMPAGAIADMHDRRIVALVSLLISLTGASALTVLAWFNLITPNALLLFCFIVGTGMIIVYAAVAGQSVVKLYAAAMFPGFFLALLYLVYIVGWALINPKIAPKLPESETRVPVRPWVAELQQAYSRKMLPALFTAVLTPAKALSISVDGARIGYTMLLKNLGFALVPLVLTVATLGATWWYVVIHQQPDISTPPPASIQQKVDDAPQPLGAGVLYLLRVHRRHLRPGAAVLLLDHGSPRPLAFDGMVLSDTAATAWNGTQESKILF